MVISRSVPSSSLPDSSHRIQVLESQEELCITVLIWAFFLYWVPGNKKKKSRSTPPFLRIFYSTFPAKLEANTENASHKSPSCCGSPFIHGLPQDLLSPMAAGRLLLQVLVIAPSLMCYTSCRDRPPHHNTLCEYHPHAILSQVFISFPTSGKHHHCSSHTVSTSIVSCRL